MSSPNVGDGLNACERRGIPMFVMRGDAVASAYGPQHLQVF